MTRCTGHCCRRFFMPMSLHELKDRVADQTKPEVRDGPMLVDMLIPLEFKDGAHWFTCKHLDQDSGDCQIYETRPWMCQAYPYGRACSYDGCTMEARGVPEMYSIKVERTPTLEQVKEAASEAMCSKPLLAPDYRPGARRSGSKPQPSVPRWARDKRSKSTVPQNRR